MPVFFFDQVPLILHSDLRMKIKKEICDDIFEGIDFHSIEKDHFATKHVAKIHFEVTPVQT